MSQSYSSLVYHLVFSTRGRRAWLKGELRGRTHQYLGGAIRDEGGVALIVNGTSDHVHILAGLRRDRAVSDVLRNMTFAEATQFAWQVGYGAFTVSASQVGNVRRYILNQEEHHKNRTFEQEFIALLKAHGIEFDERYVWG